MPRVVSTSCLSCLLLLNAGAAPFAHAQGSPEAPQFSLTGVVILDGERDMAVLAEPVLTSGGALRMKKGDRLGPYRLVSVLPDHVVLEAGPQRITVRLGGVPSPSPSGSPTVTGASAFRGRAQTPPSRRGSTAEDQKKKDEGFDVAGWLDELAAQKGATEHVSESGLRVRTFPSPPGEQPGDVSGLINSLLGPK